MHGKEIVEKALDELDDLIALAHVALAQEQDPHPGKDEITILLSKIHNVAETAFNDYRVEYRIGFSKSTT